MESIIQEIFGSIQLDQNELDDVRERLQALTLEKGNFLLKPNSEVKHLYYIHEGCLRTFFLDAKGKEHTLQFAIKGWWISDYIALFGKGNNRAVSYIECIKRATLLRISKEAFDELCIKIPKISRFHIEKLESAFASFQMQMLGNLNLSAKERYLQFIKTYPEIEQNIKNYHVASFLGITSESLSRVRREIAAQ